VGCIPTKYLLHQTEIFRELEKPIKTWKDLSLNSSSTGQRFRKAGTEWLTAGKGLEFLIKQK
jgi:pyruvate/2-oxoglutarate dehydrogenase complex dihydrolipoamide dehydrogenase (E3) component